jgi:branched-chain amino acid transport system permease protein
VAVALASAVALAIGVPVLRLKGHYLAMATLGFGTIVIAVLVGSERLGAADGITGVPPFPLPGGVAIGSARGGRVANYYVAWGLVALAMWLLGNLVESRVGRALRAIHGAEDAAASMGVDVGRTKLAAFVISAALAALGGAGLTHLTGGIGPGEASVLKSVRYLAVVAVGGMGSLWGTLATSALLTFLSLRGSFGTYDDAVFAVILLAVMLFLPDGILTLRLRAALRTLRGPGRPAPDGEAP